MINTLSFNQRVRETIDRNDSLVCVGLDTDPARLPHHLDRSEKGILEFNRSIIEATSDLALAYKPNLAFYEALGSSGWDVLKKTLEMIPDSVITIGDAKRGDIGNTAQKYAVALYDLGFDAVTINAYMGRDSVAPFIDDPSKGVFVLCLTSNPGSKDFQYLEIDNRPLYLHVAEAVRLWNEKDNCGLVVGATHPEELAHVRSIVPDAPILIPGIGAQGGDLKNAILSGTDEQGFMALINSSRGILYASPEKDFADRAREETLKLRDAINQFRHQKSNRKEV